VRGLGSLKKGIGRELRGKDVGFGQIGERGKTVAGIPSGKSGRHHGKSRTGDWDSALDVAQDHERRKMIRREGSDKEREDKEKKGDKKQEMMMPCKWWLEQHPVFGDRDRMFCRGPA
jgi:hypothetical protein